MTRLKKLESARQEFVANVSHELRTPLSLIKGYVETLLDGARDNPEVSTKFLHTIDRNAERLKLLIEDSLTMSELESSRVKLNLSTVALSPVAAKVLEDSKDRAAAKSMKLVNQARDVTVRADVDRLEQVLGNLIDTGRPAGRLGAGLEEPGARGSTVLGCQAGIPLETAKRMECLGNY